MTTVEQPQVGAAGFLAALTARGYMIAQQDGFAVFSYTVEVGRRAGEQVKRFEANPKDIGIPKPPDPPPGQPIGCGADW